MALKETFIAEMQHEAANTRKMLERVPVEHFDFKPHEKSMTLKRLASHVAELPEWTGYTLKYPELDFATVKYVPKDIRTKEDLLALHDESVRGAIADLKGSSNAQMKEIWVLRHGAHVILSMPKSDVIRSSVLNHIVHHRAQLGVYLRLLGVPIPGMYGPSADESNG